ncbi:MAG: hypothetical protein R2867_12500 [Caldilineaceae bacterium]
MVRSKTARRSADSQTAFGARCPYDEFGQGDLRFTTRQGIQLHGVIKGDLWAWEPCVH